MGKSDLDQKWMRRALALAGRGLGKTSPNPCVGAVLVQNGKKIGEGWHRAAGFAHAEVEAVQAAEKKGKTVRGSTLYVTLEPCCTHGRTPPCTDLIRAKGIKRVVVGATDPNPKHSGRGFRKLRRFGIKVEAGIHKQLCEELNRGWNHWILKHSPWVVAKCGMTLDGKIAAASGESKWITSELSRKKAHELRSRCDAVLVGVNTILRDDPLLNIRYNIKARQPIRVILDSNARIPLNSKILTSARMGEGSVWVCVDKRISPKRIHQLEKAGAMVILFSSSKNGIQTRSLLKLLGRARVVNLLVEGGSKVLTSFFEAKLVNEICFFVAPKILGGRTSIRSVAGKGFAPWRDSIEIEGLHIDRLGSDLCISGQVA